MTPEEGRALFPVLERLAYLNAGTFGPLARPTVDGGAGAARRRSRATAASARSTSSGCSSCASRRASALAALVGAEPEQISLTGSTTDGCNIVLAGLDLQPEDEIVTTDEEHFGLIGPVHASGARVVVVDAGPRRDPARP